MLVLRPGTSLILSAMGFGRQLDKSNSVTVKVTVAIFGGRRRRGVVNGLCTCCGLVQNLPVPSFFLVVSNACVCQDEKKRGFFFFCSDSVWLFSPSMLHTGSRILWADIKDDIKGKKNSGKSFRSPGEAHKGLIFLMILAQGLGGANRSTVIMTDPMETLLDVEGNPHHGMEVSGGILDNQGSNTLGKVMEGKEKKLGIKTDKWQYGE